MRRGVPELKRELREIEKSYNEVLEANIMLADETKWAREDKARALYKIERALEIINKTKFEPASLKKKIIDALTEDFFDEW